MVIDSDKKNQRTPFLFFFALYAMAVPTIAVGAIHYGNYHQLVAALFYGAQFGVFMLSGLLLVLWSLAHKEARKQRVRIRRKQTGERSPWGARRVAEPSPYSDRLATFLTANDNVPEQSAVQPQHSQTAFAKDSERTFSTMPFWSTLDLPQEPNEPKPVWIIRRTLMRIRELVASSSK